MTLKPIHFLAALLVLAAGITALQCGGSSGDLLPITTSSSEAKEEFQTGRDLFNNARSHEAWRHFQRATKADPEFALGYLFMAYTAPSAKGF